ncbi:MAG: DinB family protein [Segetibacter sp.]
MNITKEIPDKVQDTGAELTQLLTLFDQEQINTLPFEGSWTAAQVAEHVTRSNKGIARALDMEGKTADRDPEARVQELKEIFLNFNVKFQSPEFILPTQDYYQKEELLQDFKKTIAHLQETGNKVNLYDEINLPPFGEITKLELLHFVLYHTQRHIHQVKNILLLRQKSKDLV